MRYQENENVLLFKQPPGYDPARSIDDVKLSSGWYLLQRHEIKAGSEAETKDGIYMVMSKDVKIPNMAVVIKKGMDCEKADVGDYIMTPAYGGNEHDDKKAVPLVRWLGDEENLWAIHEENVHIVIPPRKIEEQHELPGMK